MADLRLSKHQAALPARLVALAFMMGVSSLHGQISPEQSTDQKIDNIMYAIEEAEAEYGPYDPGLVDMYHGFGQALLEDDDLEAALDAFHQSVIISRVNNGLNNLEQTNYLYSVANVESMLGNLEPAIDVLEHIYEIHAREYGEDNPEMLPVVEELTEWYNEVKPLRNLQYRSTDYENASFLAWRKAILTEASLGTGTYETAYANRAEGQLRFRSILYMFRNWVPSAPSLSLQGGRREAPMAVQLVLAKHYDAGEEAFQRMIQSWQANPNATIVDVAEAMAQLGDWYTVLEQSRKATKEYMKAYEYLSQGGENQALADEYFGTPTPLRFLRDKEPFARNLSESPPPDGVEVIMNVGRTGRLSNIEFRNLPEDAQPGDVEQARIRLEHTRFRPAVQMGKVVKMKQFAWRPPKVVEYAEAGVDTPIIYDQGPSTP